MSIDNYTCICKVWYRNGVWRTKIIISFVYFNNFLDTLFEQSVLEYNSMNVKHRSMAETLSSKINFIHLHVGYLVLKCAFSWWTKSITLNLGQLIESLQWVLVHCSFTQRITKVINQRCILKLTVYPPPKKVPADVIVWSTLVFTYLSLNMYVSCLLFKVE